MPDGTRISEAFAVADFSGLPAENPYVEGRPWIDDGVLKISAGPWLPVGALAYADFVEDRFWMDGAEVTFADMFTGVAYDPSDMVADGLRPHNEGAGSFSSTTLAPIGYARTLLDGPYTVFLETYLSTDGSSKLEGYDDPAFNNNPYARMILASGCRVKEAGVGGDSIDFGTLSAAAVNRLAASFDNTFIAGSLNGEAATSGVFDGVDVAVNTWLLSVGGREDTRLRRFALYALTAAAGLDELSA